MANTKISALPLATTPLAGTEVLPIVQGGITEQVATNDLTVRNIRANATTGILQITGPTAASTRVMTVPDANFTAARTDAAQSFTGNQTLSTGNLVIGTSGKGIDFSATAGTGTSELLADYEEGTWSPGIASTGTTPGTGSEYGTYVKIGRMVYASFSLNAFTSGGTQTNALQITGLPYTVENVTGNNSGHGVLINTTTTGFLRATKNATTIDIYQNDGTAITPTTAGINNSNIRGLNGTIVYRSST